MPVTPWQQELNRLNPPKKSSSATGTTAPQQQGGGGAAVARDKPKLSGVVGENVSVTPWREELNGLPVKVAWKNFFQSHNAAKAGFPEFLKAILDQGADPNKIDKASLNRFIGWYFGDSHYQDNGSWGANDSLKYLLDAGLRLEPNKKYMTIGAGGRTLFQLLGEGQTNSGHNVTNLDLMKMLLEKDMGDNPNMVLYEGIEHYGRPIPLAEYAFREERFDVLAHLVANGLDFKTSLTGDLEGQTIGAVLNRADIKSLLVRNFPELDEEKQKNIAVLHPEIFDQTFLDIAQEDLEQMLQKAVEENGPENLQPNLRSLLVRLTSYMDMFREAWSQNLSKADSEQVTQQMNSVIKLVTTLRSSVSEYDKESSFVLGANLNPFILELLKAFNPPNVEPDLDDLSHIPEKMRPAVAKIIEQIQRVNFPDAENDVAGGGAASAAVAGGGAAAAADNALENQKKKAELALPPERP